jgi:hypothetical protein
VLLTLTSSCRSVGGPRDLGADDAYSLSRDAIPCPGQSWRATHDDHRSRVAPVGGVRGDGISMGGCVTRRLKEYGWTEPVRTKFHCQGRSALGRPSRLVPQRPRWLSDSASATFAPRQSVRAM